MAWLGSTTYAGSTAVTNTLIENLNKDIRAWGGNVDAGGNSLTNCGGVQLVATARAEFNLQSASLAAKAHIAQYDNTSALYVTDNAVFTGSVWNRDDVAKAASVIQLYAQGADTFTLRRAAAGANPVTWSNLLYVNSSGQMGIGSNAPTSMLHVVGLAVYANNAAAISGGLTAGAFYRTGANPDPVCVVH